LTKRDGVISSAIGTQSQVQAVRPLHVTLLRS